MNNEYVNLWTMNGSTNKNSCRASYFYEHWLNNKIYTSWFSTNIDKTKESWNDCILENDTVNVLHMAVYSF